MPFDVIADMLREGKDKAGFRVNSHDDVVRINRRMRKVLLGH